MTCRIAIVAEAEQQLDEIDVWWLENRQEAPNLFLDEFQKALDLLEEMPDIGSRFFQANRPDIRRLLLHRSQYWIYYYHERQRSVVYIVAIWSAALGSAPRLSKP